MVQAHRNAALLAAVIAGLGACAESTPPPLDFTSTLRFARVERALVHDQQRLSGQLRGAADASWQVTLDQPGRVESLLVAVGDRVETDQVLARLRPPALASPATIASLTRARENVARARELAELGLIARVDFAAAERELGRLELAVARQLALFEIRSPSTGIVTAMATPLGGNVLAGSLVATVVDLAKLEIVAQVPEPLATSLVVGTTATARIPALSAREHEVTLRQLASAIDPARGTLEVVFALPDPPTRALPGASVIVTITQSEPRLAVVIPRQSLVLMASETFVVVREATGPVARRVRVAFLDQRRVEIVEGLDEGASVAIEGADLWLAPAEPSAPTDGGWLVLPASATLRLAELFPPERVMTTRVVPGKIELDAHALAAGAVDLVALLEVGTGGAHGLPGVERRTHATSLPSLRFSPDNGPRPIAALWQPAEPHGGVSAARLPRELAPLALSTITARPAGMMAAVAGSLILLAAPISVRATVFAALCALALAQVQLSNGVLAASAVALTATVSQASHLRAIAPAGPFFPLSLASIALVFAIVLPPALIATAVAPSLATFAQLGLGLAIAVASGPLLLAFGRGETRSLHGPILGRIPTRLAAATALVVVGAGLALPAPPTTATVLLRTEGKAAEPLERTIAVLARAALDRGAEVVTSIATHGDLDHLVIEARDAEGIAQAIRAVLPPGLNPTRRMSTRILATGSQVGSGDARAVSLALRLAQDRAALGDDQLELVDPTAWPLLRVGYAAAYPLYASALTPSAIQLVTPGPRPAPTPTKKRPWLAIGLAVGGCLLVLAPYASARRRGASPRLAWDDARALALRGVVILAGISTVAGHAQPLATLARTVLVATGLAWGTAAVLAHGAQRSHRPSTRT